MDELWRIIAAESIDIIGITESWTNADDLILEKKLCFNNFTKFLHR